jgi:hypothetical protein
MGGDGFIVEIIAQAIAEGLKMAAGIDKYLQAGKSAKAAVK